jgi:hypothetical protein
MESEGTIGVRGSTTTYDKDQCDDLNLFSQVKSFPSQHT